MHLRNRYLIDTITKRRKAFPLVGVLGARQVGKSTLLRDILAKQLGVTYITLDRPQILRDAKSRPEGFVLTHTEEFKKPIIIDEAHKAPPLFDVLKVLADERKNRGIVLLTGSVDFLSVSGIRETLTGRIGMTRLYPLTVGEIAQRPFIFRCRNISYFLPNSRAYVAPTATTREVDIWLTRGGMPALCCLGESALREEMIEEWVQSICYRDLPQLKGPASDGALAREILTAIARNSEISEAEIAKKLGEDTRRIKRHLTNLESLFVINRIKPFREADGSGFDRFCLLDAAIARYLGAEEKTLLLTLVVNELLAQHEYAGLPPLTLFHYSRRGTTKIDLIAKRPDAILPFVITERASCDHYLIKSLTAIQKTPPFTSIGVIAPIATAALIRPGIVHVPYSAITG
jgi:hypothetical protein